MEDAGVGARRIAGMGWLARAVPAAVVTALALAGAAGDVVISDTGSNRVRQVAG